MVRVDNQTEIPVRFLIDTTVKKGMRAYAPWKLYRLPESVLLLLRIPYEVLEGDSLKVGSRISSIAKAMGFGISSGGCCGCSELQKLLDAASSQWIRDHMDDIVEMMQTNAKVKFNRKFPKKMLELAVKSAIVLERRAVRHKNKQLAENRNFRAKKK